MSTERLRPAMMLTRWVCGLMLALTDRQRIELAIPAHLFYVLVATPGAFAPKDPALNARAEGDIAGLRLILKAACTEPFADLVPQKH